MVRWTTEVFMSLRRRVVDQVVVTTTEIAECVEHAQSVSKLVNAGVSFQDVIGVPRHRVIAQNYAVGVWRTRVLPREGRPAGSGIA